MIVDPDRKRLFSIWSKVKARCLDESRKDYKNYGHRGITVDQSWIKSSRPFIDWALGNGYENYLELDRIDNDGPYSPSNCRWVTKSQNARNKRNNTVVSYNGRTMTLLDAIMSSGTDVPVSTMRERLKTMDFDEAVLIPKRKYKEFIYKNESGTMNDWADRLKISRHTLRDRIYTQGTSFEEAVEKSI